MKKSEAKHYVERTAESVPRSLEAAAECLERAAQDIRRLCNNQKVRSRLHVSTVQDAMGVVGNSNMQALHCLSSALNIFEFHEVVVQEAASDES